MHNILPISIEKISEIIEGQIVGKSDLLIKNLNRIDLAEINDLTFYSDSTYQTFFESSNATCIIIRNDNIAQPKENQSFIQVANPYQCFLILINFVSKLTETNKPSNSIHKSCYISKSATIGKNVNIGFGTFIGDNCKISDNVVINNNCNLESNITIGENTIINSNVSFYPNVKTGNNCIIHSGAVIGCDGFGYNENKEDGSYTKIPHIGNVVIEDDVEIGANTTIDRSMVGSTIIRKGTKIDNLVQIGHNCVIGENVGIASQAGIAGTVNVGNRVRIGGQVGLAGHLNIVDNVSIIAQSGVSKSIAKEGTYFGSPIKEVSQAFRIEAVLRNLPDLKKDIDFLKSHFVKEN